MASLSTQSSGLRLLQFHDAEGRRRSIRLGRMPLKDARAFKTKLEQLIAARISREPLSNDVCQWLANLPANYHAKLVAAGLAQKRVNEVVEIPMLREFLDGYIEERSDLKPRTREKLKNARRNLIDFFGEERRIDTITEHDADQWDRWLKQQGYARATISKRIKLAKQYFRAAVRKRILPASPFAELKPGSQVNRARDYTVSRQEVDRVLEQCPDAQWRLIVVLSRYAGLRVPSELLRLTWADVLWDQGKMIIHASKTEHHEDGGVRVVPIFPEVAGPLQEVYDQAERPAEYVITRYRQSNANLRTQLIRIIARAGLTPWPKVFHNMRGTRQTELENEFPGHVVCTWLGNSQRTADRHYLRVTEEHFEMASKCCIFDAVGSGAGQNGEESVRGQVLNSPGKSVFSGKRQHC